MKRERHARLAELFERLVEQAPAARASALSELEPDLRRELEALLAADAQAHDPLASALAAEAVEAGAAAVGTGARIGDWRVLRELGAGGMGTVLLAERADGAFRQQAAIKLIRGFPTADGQRRLRQERQILASLDHPNIARLLDGGETRDGQPYVVMEFVEGLPLLEHVARNRLGLEARLALFDRLAAAVAHAHQRLVIHRDLKPGNVLVRPDGEPRLLDFGVAKLVDVSAASDPRQTSTRVWTPGYASPEQQRGEAITTATDVFGLGVMLRELLSGERGPGERPGLPVGFETLALDAELRGLIECATAAEPGRRYATVEALRDDLARYRAGRPLRVRPDTRAYRLRKFLVRHRFGVALGLLAAVLAAGFVWQLAVERDRASRAEQRALAALQGAERDAATARAAVDFLSAAFAAAVPERSLSADVRVRDLVDAARAELDRRTALEPGLRQPMQRLLGRLYHSLGEPGLAEPLLAAGLDGVQPQQAAEALVLAAEHDVHASVLGMLERGGDSLAAARRAEALRQRFAPGDPLQRLHSLDQLAFAHYRLGEHAEADRLWSEVLRLGPRLQPLPVDAIANAYQALGSMLDELGEHARALALSDQGLDFAAAHLAPESPNRVNLLKLRASVQLNAGDAAAAEVSLREAIALQRRSVGERGSRMGLLHNNLGLVLNDLGRYREALEAFEQADAFASEARDTPRDRAIGLANIAAVMENAGDYAQALAHFEQALTRLDAAGVASDDAARRRIERGLARCLALAGQHARARERLADLLLRAQRLEGKDSAEVALLRWQQVVLARQARDAISGREGLADARRRFAALLPDAHPLFAHMLRAEAAFARLLGDLEAAGRAQREAIARLEAAKVRPIELAIARAELAALDLESGREREARDQLGQALPILRASLLPGEVARAPAEALAVRLGLAAAEAVP